MARGAAIRVRSVGIDRVRRDMIALADATKAARRGVNVFRRDLLSVAAGVGLVGSSTVAIRSALRLLGAAFQTASEESVELNGQMRALKNEAGEFLSQLGRVMTEGDMGETVFGTLQQTMGLVTQAMLDSKEAIQGFVQNSLIFLIDGFAATATAIGLIANSARGLQMVFHGLGMIVNGLMILIRKAIELTFKGITEMLSPLAARIIEDIGVIRRIFREAGADVSVVDEELGGFERFAHGILTLRAGLEEDLETDLWDEFSVSVDEAEGKINNLANAVLDTNRDLKRLRETARGLKEAVISGTIEAETAGAVIEDYAEHLGNARIAAIDTGNALRDLSREITAAHSATSKAEIREAIEVQIELQEKLTEQRRAGYLLEAQLFDEEQAKERARIAALIKRREMMSAIGETAISVSQSVVDSIGLEGKAYRRATGALLVAEGTRQFVTAMGYLATTGKQAQGLALLAASAKTFAAAKNLGASGGRGGGGAGGGGGGVAFTQDITFVGSTAGQDTRAIADSIRRATRDGIMQAQGAQ